MGINMINVIISHDVDHLFSKDHWFRDLIYPKMWVRTTLQLVKGQITTREWRMRNTSCFRKVRNRIEEQITFDKLYGVPSTFFFGMNQGKRPILRSLRRSITRGFTLS
jgi:hypothetical protein